MTHGKAKAPPNSKISWLIRKILAFGIALFTFPELGQSENEKPAEVDARDA